MTYRGLVKRFVLRIMGRCSCPWWAPHRVRMAGVAKDGGRWVCRACGKGD